MTYKNVSTVVSELERRYGSFDWNEELISTIIKMFIEQGCKRINKLSEKHAKKMPKLLLSNIG